MGGEGGGGAGMLGGKGGGGAGRLGREGGGGERAYWEGRAARSLICLVSSLLLQAARAGEATMNDAEPLPLQGGDPATLEGPQVWLAILLDGKDGGEGPRLRGRIGRAGRRGRGWSGRAGRKGRGEERAGWVGEGGGWRACWEGRAARSLICLVSSLLLQAARAGEATMSDAEPHPLQEIPPP